VSFVLSLLPGLETIRRVVVGVALALHLLTAAVLWWISPKGFPYEHSRFWTNSVLPIAAIALAGCGLAAFHYRRPKLASLAILCFASAWAAGAVAGRICFPVSLGAVWLVGLLAAAAGLVLAVWVAGGKGGFTRAWIPCAAVGALVGVLFLRSQLPPHPSTEPINAAPPEVGGFESSHTSLEEVGSEGAARFIPSTAGLWLKRDNVRIHCSPLLEFDRISPDGFWSIFAPRRMQPPRRRYLGKATSADRNAFRYSDGSQLLLPASLGSETVELTAYVRVAADTFSHLNSFCVLEISGHKKLSLAFSPCRETVVDVRPADYPIGRPARFAYLDKSGQFHVVEATSGEKGPFHHLAVGPLKRGDALSIEIHDDIQLIAEVTLDDWSKQVSTERSPTAGWGVPINAIEFQRHGDPLESPVSIWITLAATSVGRGWDTVGHRVGIYRNQMSVRWLRP
jgi:hypothetical protein